MSNFNVQFSHPWLLLLLVPALFLAFFPYFRLAKRYRRTRNRICSLVLHTVVMVLAIFMFAGTVFNYSVPNLENELILLVDVSDTEEQSADSRDQFVETVLEMAKYDNFKVGVVTFGFDQQYAVPLTYEVDGIYEKYLSAETPDTSATNVAAALEYTKELFTNPIGGKILLISDGKETDENALSVIRSVSSRGIKVDTALIDSAYADSDIRIVDVKLPETHVKSGVDCDITVTLQSQANDEKSILGKLTLYDNGTPALETAQTINLAGGLLDVTFKHKFASSLETGDDGFHELRFEFTAALGDSLEANNEYYTYIELQDFNKILVLSGGGSSPSEIQNLLDNDDYKTLDSEGNEISTVICLDVNDIENEKYPKSVSELRGFDQVILNNVAYADMPTKEDVGFSEDFEKILYDYVNVYGGGLLTAGGNEQGSDSEAHAYNREDVRSSTYFKQLLPVDVINYTPPLGLTIIIDRSGSMSGTDSNNISFLSLAKSGALECLNALTERDYVSIMTLDSNEAIILPLTPRTHDAEIKAAIDSIEDANGSTIYASALKTACENLVTLNAVEKRHIMIVTDGQPGSNDPYEDIIKSYRNDNGITFSVVGIGVKKPQNADELDRIENAEDIPTTDAYCVLLRIAKFGGGRVHVVDRNDTSSLQQKMREDLNVPELKELTPAEFYPAATNLTSPLVSGVTLGAGSKMKVQLDGFYGVKVKSDADLVLVGDYSAPVYAQWKFGKGMVGSFMSDLHGNWSGGFLSGVDSEGKEDLSGRTFLLNVISNLMPTENIRPTDITVNLKEDNYTNTMSVYANLAEGESVTGTISELSGEELREISLSQTGGNDDFFVVLALDASNNYSRCNFVVKKGGVYKITLTKKFADNSESSYTFYKTFAYSEEYDFSVEGGTAVKNFMADIAENGNGEQIADLEDPIEVFESFVTELYKTFDPRWLFSILIIVAFLLDVAVRKFKFKWPHEIIRERKEKKQSK